MSRELTRRKTFGDDHLYRLFRSFLRPGMKLTFGVRCFGQDHVPLDGPVVLAANHQSYLDPMLAAVYVPRVFDFMARDTLFSNTVFGWLIHEVNAFPVKRGHADITSIKEALRRLKDGRALMLFPEGTRADGRIAPLQTGAVALARRGRAPIVPCAIEGAFEIWPRTRKLPRPARVWIEYGPALSPGDIEGRPDEDVAAELTTRLRDLHNGLRQRAGRATFEYTASRPPEQPPAEDGVTKQGAIDG